MPSYSPPAFPVRPLSSRSRTTDEGSRSSSSEPLSSSESFSASGSFVSSPTTFMSYAGGSSAMAEQVRAARRAECVEACRDGSGVRYWRHTVLCCGRLGGDKDVACLDGVWVIKRETRKEGARGHLGTARCTQHRNERQVTRNTLKLKFPTVALDMVPALGFLHFRGPAA